MGWLLGKKDDDLYRGDAPASVPGLDGLEPTDYRYLAPTTGPVPPYDGMSAAGTPGPAAPSIVVGQPGPHPGADVPAPSYASPVPWTSRPARKRTLTGSIIGLLVSVLLIGGLVAVGFTVVDKAEEFFENPFGGSAPREPFQGVVGTPGDVTFGDNTYQITVEAATSQSSAAWGSYSGAVSGGFLVVELTLTRTDTESAVDQISWFDWAFTPDSGDRVTGALIAGGYEPLLSTLNLASGASATGLVAFDTAAAAGTLSLTSFDGPWAEWRIDAVVPVVASGAFGAPVHPAIALTPFSATVANPRWIGAQEPAASFEPASGSYLILDLSVTLDEGAIDAAPSLFLGYDNWQFTPDGGAPITSSFAVSGADSISFSAGLPPSATTLIAFDVARVPGTLSLLNADGSVLATWLVPAP